MRPDPTILAFDTSAAHCAAALHWGKGQVVTRCEPMTRGQGERLLPLLEALLKDEGFDWADLDALAVGVGPGNFTGIRIAVSAARGLALGLEIPVISVSNFEAMRGVNSVFDLRTQLVSLPAPRGTNYIQTFKDGKATGPAQHVTVGFGMLPPLDLPDTVEVVGDLASDILMIHLNGAMTDTPQAFEREIVEVPETLIRIAVAKWEAGQVDGTPPAPLYVKPPDAAPAREQPPLILP